VHTGDSTAGARPSDDGEMDSPPTTRIALGVIAIGILLTGLFEAPAPARAAAPLPVRLAGPTGFVGPGAPVRYTIAECPVEAVAWRVTDDQGAVVTTGTETAALGATRSLPAGTAPTAGLYRLTVTCGDATGSTRFVRSAGATTVDPFFSFNVVDSTTPADGLVPNLRALGGGGYRQDLQWQAVEKTAGRFDFRPLESRIDAYVRDAGVAPLFVLDYGNVAHTGGAMTPPDMAVPAQRAAWERYVTTTVAHLRERYPDADLSYEVWNEWNNFHGPFPATPEAYLPLAEVTFRAIRSADPSARVVGPGVNAVSAAERDWMARWFAGGGARWVDAVSVHPYSQPWAPEDCATGTGCIDETLTALRTQADVHPSANGTPAPLWITEIGWPATGVLGVNEGDLAAFLVRAHVLAARSDVERVYTFELANPTSAGDRTYGVLLDAASGFEPRPAAAAYVTMQRVLAGMRATSSRASASGTREVQFDSPDGRRHVRVVWQTTDRFAKQTVSVPLPAVGQIVEPYGRARPSPGPGDR
jgi:hypothetical protein